MSSTDSTNNDPPSPAASETSAAVQLVQRFYECYATHDLETMTREILAPNVVWRIPGRHPLAGPKNGADEIVGFFAELTKANMKAEVVYLSGNDTQVVDVHRGWGATESGSMDMLWVLYYRIENGRIAEVVNFAADQAQADNFFWASYPLAPVPARLASAG